MTFAKRKFYNLFDLHEWLFGCIIILQSKHIFGNYVRVSKEVGSMELNNTIIAVDFDDTLCFSNWPNLGAPNLPLINYLHKQKNAGSKIILWTCRAGKPLEDAVKWCKQYGLVFDAINDNLPEIIELYGNNSRKITCDIYIDDRNMKLEELVGAS